MHLWGPLETSATPGSRSGLGLREFMADAVNMRDASWRGRERRGVGAWKEQGPGTSPRRTGYTAEGLPSAWGVTSAAWELKGEAQRGPRCQETQEPGPLRRVFSQNLEKTTRRQVSAVLRPFSWGPDINFAKKNALLLLAALPPFHTFFSYSFGIFFDGWENEFKQFVIFSCF